MSNVLDKELAALLVLNQRVIAIKKHEKLIKKLETEIKDKQHRVDEERHRVVQMRHDVDKMKLWERVYDLECQLEKLDAVLSKMVHTEKRHFLPLEMDAERNTSSSTLALHQDGNILPDMEFQRLLCEMATKENLVQGREDKRAQLMMQCQHLFEELRSLTARAFCFNA